MTTMPPEGHPDALAWYKGYKEGTQKYEKEIKRLRETLKFYAAEGFYYLTAIKAEPGNTSALLSIPILDDRGNRARQALANNGNKNE